MVVAFRDRFGDRDLRGCGRGAADKSSSSDSGSIVATRALANARGAFQEGLRKLGYVEGQNITIEYRYAEEKLDRLPDMANELVRSKVDLIVAVSTPAIKAAKNSTNTIP